MLSDVQYFGIFQNRLLVFPKNSIFYFYKFCVLKNVQLDVRKMFYFPKFLKQFVPIYRNIFPKNALFKIFLKKCASFSNIFS